jgi:phosphoribosylformylglycinamidine synthase subunit PurSL
MREYIVSPEIHRIYVASRPEIPDVHAVKLASQARRFLGISLERVCHRSLYYLPVRLEGDELEKCSRVVCDPVTSVCSLDQTPADRDFDFVVTIRFKAGVTDNLGSTAREVFQEILNRSFLETEAVVSAKQILMGSVSRSEAEQIAKEFLFNDLIEDAFIEPVGNREPDPVLVGRKLHDFQPQVQVENLDLSDSDLIEFSRSRVLALNLEELRVIRDYFKEPRVHLVRKSHGLTDQPTDVELECLAQTWSEHCHHKVFNAEISYTGPAGEKREIRSLFDTYIRGLTQKLASPFLVSVFHDNAGIVRFHERYDLVYKVETHNSPSALDPYGGAMTGIVGVDRDPLGTGLGAELLAHTKGFCLADPRSRKSPGPGLLAPERIRDGVHLGVQEGGNQTGIPLLRGFEYFDHRFRGKPLVFCGTLGRIPAKIGKRLSHENIIHAGDLIVMVGGRVGKDGIHGATFSSIELSQDATVQAVQIGDPITQKKMSDCLLVARDQGLYRCITDNGAGGLSSSAGELAQLCGGLEMDLEKVPLKYPGLLPWEILVSESQERMTLAVDPEKLEELMVLCSKRGVEASVLGHFTDSGSLHLRYGERTVAHLDMDFLHKGDPALKLEGSFRFPKFSDPNLPDSAPEAFLPVLLERLNLCSREEKLRQYDHEVQGLSVVRLLTGEEQDSPPDAAVMMLDHAGCEGIILTEGVNPGLSDLDPYAMATWVVDEAVRRVISSGGDLSKIAGVDNFCWPSTVNDALPNRSQKLGQLVRACEGLYDACLGFSIPLISGKDSMANDCTRLDPPVSVPPTLLFSVIAPISDVRQALTLDPKIPGDLLYIVGKTGSEMGGSEFFRMLAELDSEPKNIGSKIPGLDLSSALATFKAVESCVQQSLLRSCHAVSMGGLGVGIARMFMAGHLGLDVDLSQVPSHGQIENDLILLYSETCSRFLLTIDPCQQSKFESLLSAQDFSLLGQVSKEPILQVKGLSGNPIIETDLRSLKSHYKRTLGVSE